MAPKASKAPSGDQRARDAEFIFSNLFHVATPVMFNISEIAAQTGDKPNTISKRFSVLRNRYPGLKVACGSTGAASTSAARVSDVSSAPPTPGPVHKRGTTGNQKPAKKAKKAPVARQTSDADSDDDEDADEDGDDTIFGPADDEATPAKPAHSKRKRSTTENKSARGSKPATKRVKKAQAPETDGGHSATSGGTITTVSKTKGSSRAGETGAKSANHDDKDTTPDLESEPEMPTPNEHHHHQHSSVDGAKDQEQEEEEEHEDQILI